MLAPAQRLHWELMRALPWCSRPRRGAKVVAVENAGQGSLRDTRSHCSVMMDRFRWWSRGRGTVEVAF